MAGVSGFSARLLGQTLMATYGSPAKSYASQFHTWNPAALSFNAILKSGSVAIGAGTATGAPTVDILGVARAAPYTVGADSYPY